MFDSIFNRLYPYFPRELGLPYRILVNSREEMLKTIRQFDGKTDIFASVYDASLIVDKLFYDFDGNPEEAKIFYTFLTEEKDLTVIPVHSGKRGIHLYILLRPSPPDKMLLTDVMLGLIEECFNGKCKTVDSHTFGNLRQLARVPNTRRPGLGTYCVPLPLDWTKMTPAQLMDYIRSPRRGEFEPRKFPSLSDFPRIQRERKGEIIIPAPVFKIPQDERLFKDILRPCLWRAVHEKNPSHPARVATTIDLLNSGISPETILHWYSTLGWRDFDVKTIKYQIDHIARAGYHSYSCRRLRELKIPRRCCVE